MTLYDWTVDLFKNGVELFSNEQIIVKNNTTIRRDCTKLKKCSIGIISANDARAWYDVCRLNCDVGTIIEDYDETKWNKLYNDVSTLVKLALTECLIKERQAKSAKVLLDILERRSRTEWQKETKTTTVDINNKENNNMNITFRVVES